MSAAPAGPPLPEPPATSDLPDPPDLSPPSDLSPRSPPSDRTSASDCGASSSVTVNSLPRPGSLSSVSWPCIRSIRLRVITSPIPSPSTLLCSAPSRLKGSNRCAACSASMPMPSSRTRSQTRPSPACAGPLPALPSGEPASRPMVIRTLPAGRLYLIALLSRLASTCRSRVMSARTQGGRVAGGVNSSATWCWLAIGASSAMHSRTSSCSGTLVMFSTRRPDSMRARSSISLIMSSRCQPARSMLPMVSRWPADSGSRWLRSISWVKPSMALSGVRSSWLMRDRNSVLA